MLKELKCLYSLKDQCSFNTTVHKIKYSGRNKLLYHVTVSCLVDVPINKMLTSVGLLDVISFRSSCEQENKMAVTGMFYSVLCLSAKAISHYL